MNQNNHVLFTRDNGVCINTYPSRTLQSIMHNSGEYLTYRNVLNDFPTLKLPNKLSHAQEICSCYIIERLVMVISKIYILFYCILWRECKHKSFLKWLTYVMVLKADSCCKGFLRRVLCATVPQEILGWQRTLRWILRLPRGGS